MYGLVNKSIEDLVRGRFGEGVWGEIRKRAGVEVEYFVSNQSYPDELTYRLVGAASAVLGMPAEKVLETFGEHWVLATAKDSYGPLLKAGGATFPAFLANLPNFHTRISLMFPNLKPPRFVVSDRTPTSLRLHYHTHREGLAHFVLGLLSGLAKFYETEVSVSHAVRRGPDSDHDVFEVRWTEAMS